MAGILKAQSGSGGAGSGGDVSCSLVRRDLFGPRPCGAGWEAGEGHKEFKQREQQVQKKRNKHDSVRPPQSMCSVSTLHRTSHTASPPHTNLQAVNFPRCKCMRQALYAAVALLYFTGFCSTRLKGFPLFFAFVFYVCIICAGSIINMLLCSQWCLWGYLG